MEFMKSLSTRQKCLVLGVFTFLIIIGSYTFKRYINDMHYHNQNYLATNIRQKKKEDFTYEFIEVDLPLKKSELISYSKHYFKENEKPTLIHLKNIHVFDSSLQHIDSVYSTVDAVYNTRLFIGSLYSTEKSMVNVPSFSIVSSKQVRYLKKNQMLYSIKVDGSPEQWFPYLSEYIRDIRTNFKDQTKSSLVYIQTEHAEYFYVSDHASQLFKIETLSS